ncbi:hypothetical protein ACEN9D_28780 [Pseudomonas sp. CT11-2]|uniref:hypothetical protein n=1 Tax=unclassified Pseudomonas TaxID=196821 RepID=UPI00215E176D|nr:hypothetical protein [Pseudomonas sp. B21-019]UVM35414.1 hypothetical protein LOY36_12180 [Pseudomonas sp. B21-019]
MIRPSIDSPSLCYTLYYDESNNHRKFYINENKNNYNIDNDPNRKQAAATNFMLGGVAHKKNECKANATELIEGLKLQDSVKELKFGVVARGSFDQTLKSAPLKKILKWLLDSDLYVHYFNLNLEYWAFIDIIDDCTHHCVQNHRLEFKSDLHFREYLDFHKDVLYRVIKADKEKFIGLVKEFRYPFIEGQEQPFVEALHKYVVDYSVKLFMQQPRPDRDEINAFLSLAELFSISLDIEDMTLTLNLEEGVLVDGLSVFYQNRGLMLSHSEHIFDDEFSVEDEIAVLNRSGQSPNFKYKFVKSIETPLTQISDVVAGLFAKYFEFIEKNTLSDLTIIRKKLSPQQLETLNLIRALIEKSHDECEHLLFYVMTLSEHKKHVSFMFPDVKLD